MTKKNEQTSLKAMVERYLGWMLKRGDSEETVIVRRRMLRYFNTWAEERSIIYPQDATREHIESYQQYLFNYRKVDGDPLSWSSQKHRLSAVKQFFSYMAQKYIILYNPASELQIPKESQHLPKDILTPEDVEKIVAQINLKTPEGIRNRCIIEVLWCTGIRRKALAALQLNDVDFGREILFISQAKGRKDRYVPLSRRCMNWIKLYLDEVREILLKQDRDLKTLFVSVTGEALSRQYYTELVRKYIKDAELGKKGSCHLFRHSVATNMLDNGCDIRHIQEMLGHSSLKTTQRYTQVSIQKLKEAHNLTHPTCVPKGLNREKKGAK